jgi:hypothetical protein
MGVRERRLRKLEEDCCPRLKRQSPCGLPVRSRHTVVGVRTAWIVSKRAARPVSRTPPAKRTICPDSTATLKNAGVNPRTRRPDTATEMQPHAFSGPCQIPAYQA